MKQATLDHRAVVIACGLRNPHIAGRRTGHRARHHRRPRPGPLRTKSPPSKAGTAKNSFPRDAILFVGSSSIRIWQTADAFPDLPVINRGFGGSHISDVNHYFDDVVTKYRPQSSSSTPATTTSQAANRRSRSSTTSPSLSRSSTRACPIRTSSALPIKPSVARWDKWPQMQQTNALVADLDRRDDRLEIVDTATAAARRRRPAPQRALSRRRPPPERQGLRDLEQSPGARPQAGAGERLIGDTDLAAGTTSLVERFHQLVASL